MLKIPDPVSGGQVKVTFQEGRSFLNALDIDNASISMDMVATDREGGTLVASVDVLGSFVDFSDDSTYEQRFVATVTGFPNNLTLTSAQLASIWDLTTADLDGGDRFEFEYHVTMTDGRVFTPENTSDGICLEENSRGTCTNFTFVGCPTEVVEGSYTGTPLPCINAPFGDARAADDDVEISQTDVVNWRISNADLGYYVPFGFPTQPLTLLDVCNTFSLDSRAEASFGISVEGGSMYDPATSTATLRWLDAGNSGIECISEFTLN